MLSPATDSRQTCCQNDFCAVQISNVVLSLLYVLIGAKRADFSTISTFVNFLMRPPKGTIVDKVSGVVHMNPSLKIWQMRGIYPRLPAIESGLQLE